MCTIPAATTNPDGTITITKPTLALPGDVESGWRWCQRCLGLHLKTDTLGICPVPPKSQPGQPAMVIGPHSEANSGRYALFHTRATGCVQTGWKRCSKCHGLVFGARPDGRSKVTGVSAGG